MCDPATMGSALTAGGQLGGDIVSAKTQADAMNKKTEAEKRMKMLEMALMYGSGNPNFKGGGY